MSVPVAAIVNRSEDMYNEHAETTGTRSALLHAAYPRQQVTASNRRATRPLTRTGTSMSMRFVKT